jgi:hypothetical protein
MNETLLIAAALGAAVLVVLVLQIVIIGRQLRSLCSPVTESLLSMYSFHSLSPPTTRV